MHDLVFMHIPRNGGTSIINAFGGELRVVRHDIYSLRYTSLRDYLMESGKRPSVVFAVVRNPFDRLVSAWCHLQDSGVNKYDERDRLQVVGHYESFSDFVVGEIRTGRSLGLLHFRPQSSWVTGDHGENLVDFLIHFERLGEELGVMCQTIGMECPDLEIVNSSQHCDWREYYDDETRAMVRSAYQHDFKRFGYEC